VDVEFVLLERHGRGIHAVRVSAIGT
jgi:hypothetical protein